LHDAVVAGRLVVIQWSWMESPGCPRRAGLVRGGGQLRDDLAGSTDDRYLARLADGDPTLARLAVQRIDRG
jgi:hypothetical protein